MSHLPTIVIIHPRERRAKCSVLPLRGRAGFVFHKFPRVPQDLGGYVKLGIEGPQLGPADAERGLIVLDSNWRRVGALERVTAHVPTRRLPLLVTAYPRISRVSDDPAEGLATIEALYAAYRLLGRDTTGLLDHYHWAAEFVERNRLLWPPRSAAAGAAAARVGS